MPVGSDGITVDFDPTITECQNFGHSFEYVCPGDGATFTSKFNWKPIVLEDAASTQTKVFAPITGSQVVAVSGEAIVGPTGPTGTTGAALSALQYNFATFDFDTDYASQPGIGVQGKIQFNDGTPDNTTEIRLSKLDAKGANSFPILEQLTNLQGISGERCAAITVRVINSGSNDANYATFYITDLAESNTHWKEFTVEFVASNAGGDGYDDLFGGVPGEKEGIVSIQPLAKGATGNTGSAGPEGITFNASATTSNTIVFGENMSADPQVLNIVPQDFIEVFSGSKPVLNRVKEGVLNEIISDGDKFYEFDANAGKNTRFLTRGNSAVDLEGVTFTNWQAGDYGTLIFMQPTGATYAFNSDFLVERSAVAEGGAASTTVYHATGQTYALGNEVADLDIFYIYCFNGSVAGGTASFIINHQLYHDGV